MFIIMDVNISQIGPSELHALPLGDAAERRVHYFWDFFSFTYFSPRMGCREILHGLLIHKNIRIPLKNKIGDPLPPS